MINNQKGVSAGEIRKLRYFRHYQTWLDILQITKTEKSGSLKAKLKQPPTESTIDSVIQRRNPTTKLIYYRHVKPCHL